MTDYYDDHACIELLAKAFSYQGRACSKEDMLKRHSEWRKAKGL
jgi:hypothetical protein